MKKTLLILAMASAMIISSCAVADKADDTNTNDETQQELNEGNVSMGGLQVVNPIKNYENAQGIADALGFTVNPIPGAENISFSTISNDIAQARYMYEGLEYTLRANDDEGDSSGVYTAASSEETLTVEISGGSAIEVLVKNLTDGNTLLSWSDNTIHYSLYIIGAPEDISTITTSTVLSNANN